MEPNEILIITSIVSKTFGPIFGTFHLLTIFAFCFFYFFWKKRIENLADEITSKTIKSFDTRLSLSLYDEIWTLYNRYQETWLSS
jgi:hypothetical protein